MQTNAAYSKCLSDATAYLEERLLIPMEELSQRLKYRLELLRHMYSSQVDILQGAGDLGVGVGGGAEEKPGQIVRVKEDDAIVAKLMSILGKVGKTKEDFAE